MKRYCLINISQHRQRASKAISMHSILSKGFINPEKQAISNECPERLMNRTCGVLADR